MGEPRPSPRPEPAPDYDVTAVYARRPDAARAAAERFGIARIAASEDELIAMPDLDLILVLNTAPQHADTVRKVIAAGRDVYSEWPLTTSSTTAADLLERARRPGADAGRLGAGR